ncbi:MAG: iron-sulfur cluster repair di-iron protein [Bacteroidales bacterium]|nr:iron-sulfur cluster repair di-iron protein [Bacteroidales bacterium]
MKNYDNMTVAEIVAQDYRAADIFREHNIDFCCGGNIRLTEACNPLQINVQHLISQISQLETEPADQTDQYIEWSPDLLADYIEQTHHVYVTRNIPVITAYLQKIVSVHGENHPELHRVLKLFLASSEELTDHMKREEMVLFPFIRQMTKGVKEGREFRKPGFGTVINPISRMMTEHTTEGNRFREMSALTNQYAAPSDACNTYVVTLAKLNEFELDLHKHIHLENNILFPKAIEMENVLLSN